MEAGKVLVSMEGDIKKLRTSTSTPASFWVSCLWLQSSTCFFGFTGPNTE